ncbi:MAG: hypothetical protein CUN49_03300 [Candidatus Thermofonsia Clade 1 bacterium]|jgi:hypothetical protein|uniref:Uncharacterized protein n=1 Tax=Candidatus Thermofonsia Clade 1 bacterium TaxID=2364210 RepID=A0A2M8PH36_9CHLR|nr:MAG: hypothetical protein CUN49_03300 [Candidatus Thermofonsia Clade 1 bacterium]RMF53679.1 MAG: hypothetical protein D6749_01645 [Chloroflexota bacterium]
MSEMDSQTHSQASEPETPLEIDRSFTYRVTIASLIVGVILAGIAALILFSLARPLTADEQGNVNWSLSGLLFPAAAVFVGTILFWSVFGLPLRVARRRGVILDPEIYPWTGAVLLGVFFIGAFVLAIAFGII